MRQPPRPIPWAVGHHALDLMLHLANGSLDSAPVRVARRRHPDERCRAIRGFRQDRPREGELAGSSPPALSTMGRATVDLEEAIWASAVKNDSSVDTFRRR